MQTIEESSFWCWKHKLFGVVYFLHMLAGRHFSEDSYNVMLEELRHTNSGKNDWFVHNISIAPSIWQLALALDEDDRDIVTIRIKAPSEFQERIHFLGQIQSSLSTIEIELH
jgi:hypothetical protein